MRKQLIGVMAMILVLFGFSTCAYALTISGDLQGNEITWSFETSSSLTIQEGYSIKDLGDDWICENNFTNIRQLSENTGYWESSLNETFNLLTIKNYNSYPGYFNKINFWVKNSGSSNTYMTSPVLNWLGNEYQINDFQTYLLLADGRIMEYTEPVPENALIEICWGNHAGELMEPGDRIDEGFIFHVLSNKELPPTFNPSIDILKEVNVDKATIGTEIIYTYTVTNTGDVSLTGVNVTDDKLGVISLDKSYLAPGESISSTATYTVQEGDLPGPLLNTATVAGYYNETEVTAQDDASVILIVPCEELNGLTPGYWKNWRNHYNNEQFNALLAGTIAPDINTADAIFSKYSSKPGMKMTILKAHLLATQLTLNLIKMPNLANPDNAYLVESGLVEWGDVEITIGEAVQQVLDIWANPSAYTRSQILEAKNLLDYINNL